MINGGDGDHEDVSFLGFDAYGIQQDVGRLH